MQDIRWRRRFENYLRAFQMLVEAVELAKSRELSLLEQLGLIKTFANTHELAWKVLIAYLEKMGITGLIGPRDAARVAFKMGLIEQGDDWLKMVEVRKLTLQTYSHETVEALVGDILNRFYPGFASMAGKFARLSDEQEMGA